MYKMFHVAHGEVWWPLKCSEITKLIIMSMVFFSPFYLKVRAALYSTEYGFFPSHLYFYHLCCCYSTIFFALRIAFIILNKIIALHIFCLCGWTFEFQLKSAHFFHCFFRLSSALKLAREKNTLAKAFQMHKAEIPQKLFIYFLKMLWHNEKKNQFRSLIKLI